jgi:predicted CoA-binding protein
MWSAVASATAIAIAQPSLAKTAGKRRKTKKLFGKPNWAKAVAEPTALHIVSVVRNSSATAMQATNLNHASNRLCGVLWLQLQL